MACMTPAHPQGKKLNFLKCSTGRIFLYTFLKLLNTCPEKHVQENVQEITPCAVFRNYDIMSQEK